MNCEEALVLLSGHLDGENTADEEARLQAHLAQCEDCRNLLADLQALEHGVLSLEEAPPDGLCRRVMETIREEGRRRKKRRRWIWPAAAAVLALALLAGAGTLAASPAPAEAPRLRQAVTEAEPETVMEAEPETVTEAEPETAEKAEPAAASAGGAAPASLSPEVFSANRSAVSPVEDSVQALAEERCAPVVALHISLPELEGLSREVLEDGSLLYTLEGRDRAKALWEAHPDDAALYLPEAEAADVSYALLLP